MKWIALFFTNFAGVFNDNLLKNLISFIAISWLSPGHESLVIMGATSCLVLPYVLFSPLAGRLAKQYRRASILRVLKLAELPIMFIAIAGFYLQSVATVLVSMSLMGLQSCLYSPAKYGLIRDVGGREGISFGTGMMEMLTFIGILIGAYAAGTVSDITGQLGGLDLQKMILSALLSILAISGYIASLGVHPHEEQTEEDTASSINPLRFIITSYHEAKNYPGLNLVILGLSFFWIIGSLVQMVIILHCPRHYGMSNTETSLVMAGLAVGMGAGSALSGILSRKRVALEFIPLAGSAMALSFGAIFFLRLSAEMFMAATFTAALAAGFYKIPLNAWIQDRVHGRKLGDMIAYDNLVVFLFILLSAGIFAAIENMFGTNAVFGICMVLSASISVILQVKLKK